MHRRERWPSIVGGVIGGILVAGFLFAGATALSHPADSLRGNIAMLGTDLMYVALGVFLIGLAFRKKQAEDAGKLPTTYEPNSADDIEFLKKRRNWIFGFVFLIEIIGSFSTWVLNKYGAGWTPINIETIFDIVLNLVFIYFVIQLLKNKDILKMVLFTVIFYCAVEAGIDIWRTEWAGIVSNVLFAAYFIYAIKAPVNRKNHRIAHMMILPTFIVVTIAIATFSTGKIDQMWKNEAKLEQEYSNYNTDVRNAYGTVLQSTNPTGTNIQDVRDALAKRDQKISEIVSALNAIQAEYRKQESSDPQQAALTRIQNILDVLALDREQGNKVGDLMVYDSNVNFKTVTDKQLAEMNAMIRDVNTLDSEIRDASLKLSN